MEQAIESDKKVRISCPHMGVYTRIIRELADDAGWEVLMPPPPSKRTVALGVKYMNELMCFPAKITLGSLIEAAEKGSKNAFMFDSCGDCRQKTYWILQNQVLNHLGYDIKVHPVTLSKRIIGDLRSIDPAMPRWKALWLFLTVMRKVKKFDDETWFSQTVPARSKKPKIGVVGEIYTVLEPAVNMNIIEKLQKMDVWVHNSLPLSFFVFKVFYEKGLFKRKDIDMEILKKAKKEADRYFPKETVGGHGKDSIIHTIYYALKGFDGVVHLLPFPCMPESTVAPILDAISEDYGIPVLRLIFDEHSGEAGLDTRLEAFVDVLRRKKRGKSH